MEKKDDVNSAISSSEHLNHYKFSKFMAKGKQMKLVNDHHAPISELIHPLSYSNDPKKYPDMNMIFCGYTFQRGFYKLYKELKKEPIEQ
jgi:hypothetical protein